MSKTYSLILASAAVAATIAGMGAVSTAQAADVAPGKASLWDGFYVGVTGGYASGNADISAKLRQDQRDALTQIVSEDGKGDLDGGMIGGLVGFDYALGNGIVLGVAGDLSWLGANGDIDVDPAVAGLTGSDYSIETDVNWLGTVRARIGFELGNALIYGTGGLAFGGVDNDLHVAGGGNIGSSSGTQVGWTVGGGINYMATDHLMLGLEYLYVDLGKDTYDFGKAGKADVDLNMSIVRGSVSYKF